MCIQKMGNVYDLLKGKEVGEGQEYKYTWMVGGYTTFLNGKEGGEGERYTYKRGRSGVQIYLDGKRVHDLIEAEGQEYKYSWMEEGYTTSL